MLLVYGLSYRRALQYLDSKFVAKTKHEKRMMKGSKKSLAANHAQKRANLLGNQVAAAGNNW